MYSSSGSLGSSSSSLAAAAAVGAPGGAPVLLDPSLHQRLGTKFLIDTKMADDLNDRQRIALLGNLLHVYDPSWLVPSMPILIGMPSALQALSSSASNSGEGTSLSNNPTEEWADKKSLAKFRSWLNRAGVGHIVPPGLRLIDSKKFGHLVWALMDKVEQQYGNNIRLNAHVRGIMAKHKKLLLAPATRRFSSQQEAASSPTRSNQVRRLSTASLAGKVVEDKKGAEKQTQAVIPKGNVAKKNKDNNAHNELDDVEDMSSKVPPPKPSKELARTPMKPKMAKSNLPKQSSASTDEEEEDRKENEEEEEQAPPPLPSLPPPKFRIHAPFASTSNNLPAIEADKNDEDGGGFQDDVFVVAKIKKKVTMVAPEDDDPSTKVPPKATRELPRTPIKPTVQLDLSSQSDEDEEDDDEDDNTAPPVLKLSFNKSATEERYPSFTLSPRVENNRKSTESGMNNSRLDTTSSSRTPLRKRAIMNNSASPSVVAAVAEARRRSASSSGIPVGGQLIRTPPPQSSGFLNVVGHPRGSYVVGDEDKTSNDKRGEKRKLDPEDVNNSFVVDVFDAKGHDTDNEEEAETSGRTMNSTYNIGPAAGGSSSRGGSDSPQPSSSFSPHSPTKMPRLDEIVPPLQSLTKNRAPTPQNRRPPTPSRSASVPPPAKRHIANNRSGSANLDDDEGDAPKQVELLPCLTRSRVNGPKDRAPPTRKEKRTFSLTEAAAAAAATTNPDILVDSPFLKSVENIPSPPTRNEKRTFSLIEAAAAAATTNPDMLVDSPFLKSVENISSPPPKKKPTPSRIPVKRKAPTTAAAASTNTVVPSSPEKKAKMPTTLPRKGLADTKFFSPTVSVITEALVKRTVRGGKQQQQKHENVDRARLNASSSRGAELNVAPKNTLGARKAKESNLTVKTLRQKVETKNVVEEKSSSSMAAKSSPKLQNVEEGKKSGKGAQGLMAKSPRNVDATRAEASSLPAAKSSATMQTGRLVRNVIRNDKEVTATPKRTTAKGKVTKDQESKDEKTPAKGAGRAVRGKKVEPEPGIPKRPVVPAKSILVASRQTRNKVGNTTMNISAASSIVTAKQDASVTAEIDEGGEEGASGKLNTTLRDEIPQLKLPTGASMKLKDDIYLTPSKVKKSKMARPAAAASTSSSRIGLGGRLAVSKLDKKVPDEVYQTPTPQSTSKGLPLRPAQSFAAAKIAKELQGKKGVTFKDEGAPTEYVRDDVYETPAAALIRRSARNKK